MTTRATTYADTASQFIQTLYSGEKAQKVVTYAKEKVEKGKDIVEAGLILKGQGEKKVKEMATTTFSPQYASMVNTIVDNFPLAIVYVLNPGIALRGGAVYVASSYLLDKNDTVAKKTCAGIAVGSAIKAVASTAEFVITGNPFALITAVAESCITTACIHASSTNSAAAQ